MITLAQAERMAVVGGKRDCEAMDLDTRIACSSYPAPLVEAVCLCGHQAVRRLCVGHSAGRHGPAWCIRCLEDEDGDGHNCLIAYFPVRAA